MIVLLREPLGGEATDTVPAPLDLEAEVGSRWIGLTSTLTTKYPASLPLDEVRLRPADLDDAASLGVRAVLADPEASGSYYLFADGCLWRLSGEELALVAEVPGINLISTGIGDGRNEGAELEIALYADGAWVAVTERFGVNAAVVDTRTGAVRPYQRADYHADVTTYSFGFVHHEGRTVVAAQTEWNRLDLFDAETGELLTEREVAYREAGHGPDGKMQYEYVNYIDYFHSRLDVSPAGSTFLSNGWVWQPMDLVRAYRVDAFLAAYDPSGVSVDAAFGYNWDRPATFIDEDTFVLAVDDNTENLDTDELPGYRYHQLAFFTVPELPTTERWRPPVRQAECDAFPRNEYGEVKGELHYDRQSGLLVALTTTAGTALVTLDGAIVQRLPELNAGSRPTDWTYSPAHRCFYRWHQGQVAERPFPSLLEN
jgi:hypothetical protein